MHFFLVAGIQPEVGRKIGVKGHRLVRELERSLERSFPAAEVSRKNLSRDVEGGTPPISRRAHQFLSLRGVDKRTASEKVNCDCALPRLCFVHAFCFQVPGSES